MVPGMPPMISACGMPSAIPSILLIDLGDLSIKSAKDALPDAA